MWVHGLGVTGGNWKIKRDHGDRGGQEHWSGIQEDTVAMQREMVKMGEEIYFIYNTCYRVLLYYLCTTM